jgi:hypothetical protein
MKSVFCAVPAVSLNQKDTFASLNTLLKAVSTLVLRQPVRVSRVCGGSVENFINAGISSQFFLKSVTLIAYYTGLRHF